MTHIEQIKAHIHDLEAQLVKGASASQVSMESACKAEAYNEVLAFIESLEKERDTSFESAWGAYVNSRGGGAITTNVKTLSKQFYELGCTHAAVLYDDIEHERQRRQEAEKPKGLDEAAEEYAMQQIGYADKEMAESSYAKHNKLKVAYFSGYDLAEAFDAGAKWQAGQGRAEQ